MPMKYDDRENVYKFSKIETQNFINKYLNTATWNEMSLKLLVETFTNFIDTTTKYFMSNNCIESAVWIFKQLYNINEHVKKKKCHFVSEKDPVLEKIGLPLLEYRLKMSNTESQPEWIREIDKALTQPHQLCMGNIYAINNIEKLQPNSVVTRAQKAQAHDIFSAILTNAIATLKQSNTYKKAEEEGCPSYKLAAKDISSTKTDQEQEPPTKMRKYIR